MDKNQYQVVVEFSAYSYIDKGRFTTYEQRDVTASSEEQAKRIAEKRVLKCDRYRTPEIIRSEVM